MLRSETMANYVQGAIETFSAIGGFDDFDVDDGDTEEKACILYAALFHLFDRCEIDFRTATDRAFDIYAADRVADAGRLDREDYGAVPDCIPGTTQEMKDNG